FNSVIQEDFAIDRSESYLPTIIVAIISWVRIIGSWIGLRAAATAAGGDEEGESEGCQACEYRFKV
ncbi:hypothetical protein HNR37_002277, partial [Desulfurispira natronophila]|nr:hypothetical protein [Desulfurispira natronophila]